MCALKVFYEPEQLTSQPVSQGREGGAREQSEGLPCC